MSSRLVKRQLSTLAAAPDTPQPSSLQPQTRAAKKKARKVKAKALKARAAAAAKEPHQVYQKNLAYFRSTKGPQGETAELMNKVRAVNMVQSTAARPPHIAGCRSPNTHPARPPRSCWASLQPTRTTIRTTSTCDSVMAHSSSSRAGARQAAAATGARSVVRWSAKLAAAAALPPPRPAKRPQLQPLPAQAGGQYGDVNALAGMFMAYAMQLQQQQQAQQQQGPVNNAAQLTVRGLAYHPPGAEAPLVQDVSFSLPPNQLGLVIGRSGSGKTTLLQVGRAFAACLCPGLPRLTASCAASLWPACPLAHPARLLPPDCSCSLAWPSRTLGKSSSTSSRCPLPAAAACPPPTSGPPLWSSACRRSAWCSSSPRGTSWGTTWCRWAAAGAGWGLTTGAWLQQLLLQQLLLQQQQQPPEAFLLAGLVTAG
jgi:hypothetical protein